MSAASNARSGQAADDRNLSPLAVRVRGEYLEMPGLRLNVAQAARLFALTPDIAVDVLEELQRESVLTRSDAGLFALVSAGH